MIKTFDSIEALQDYVEQLSIDPNHKTDHYLLQWWSEDEDD